MLASLRRLHHLIAVQAADRSLVVGDSHEYDLSPDPYQRKHIDDLILTAFAETLPGFEMSSFVALVVPAGTPPAVIEKLSEVSARILRDSATSKKLAGVGLVVTANPPSELAKTIKEGLAVRGKLIKASGMQPE